MIRMKSLIEVIFKALNSEQQLLQLYQLSPSYKNGNCKPGPTDGWEIKTSMYLYSFNFIFCTSESNLN